MTHLSVYRKTPRVQCSSVNVMIIINCIQMARLFKTKYIISPVNPQSAQKSQSATAETAAADNIHHKAAMYRIPQQVMRNDYVDTSSSSKHHHRLKSRGGGGGSEDRSSTTSSFTAWRSNNCHPMYSSSRFDDLWPKMQRWWNILKWPMVLMLICSILGLFIYFLLVGG